MNALTARFLAEISAVNAEIEGMKVANLLRERNGYAFAYDEESFNQKAQQLRSIANQLYDAWQQGSA